MSEFTTLREAVESLAARSPMPDLEGLERRAVRRGRRRIAVGSVVAAVVAAVIAGSALSATGPDDPRTLPAGPARPAPPTLAEGVPEDAVWFDRHGLHRGDVVERTPVDIIVPERPVPQEPGGVFPQKGSLALVRSGALYGDPATKDVWFHPWGGAPRIVGRDSASGPGGDPDGDTAAWFEGAHPSTASPGKLVVYDTASGRELSRTEQESGAIDCSGICGDHSPPGNGFLQVAADRVVWVAPSRDFGPVVYDFDVRTQRTTQLQDRVRDVHDGVRLSGEPTLTLTAPGRDDVLLTELEAYARLSPSGRFVLGLEDSPARHGATVLDTRTGELWRVPNDQYPWIAWSYDDVAMLDVDDGLVACEAARQLCERVPAERPFLMPSN